MMVNVKFLGAVLGMAVFVAAGCSRDGGRQTIKITGSDTMVNLSQAWQERYNQSKPDISIQVKGGGSGVGIAALCSGKAEIATSSRQMKAEELELAEKNTGKKPVELIVGLDALAIYVHPLNPIEEISIPELADIYGEGGGTLQWKQLGVDNANCSDGQIIRISRQNSSGTYLYFKEAVLGKGREYKQGASAQSGSSDVVALISNTPCALGYSGMGYKTDSVKFVRVAKQKGGQAVMPSLQTASDGSYPISRPLFLYTLGEPTGHVKDFVDWMLAPEGQQIVRDLGYVPAPADESASADEATPADEAPPEDEAKPAEEPGATTEG